jgi:hypothetical protein
VFPFEFGLVRSIIEGHQHSIIIGQSFASFASPHMHYWGPSTLNNDCVRVLQFLRLPISCLSPLRYTCLSFLDWIIVTLKMASIRLLVSIATIHHWPFHKLDNKNAFYMVTLKRKCIWGNHLSLLLRGTLQKNLILLTEFSDRIVPITYFITYWGLNKL